MNATRAATIRLRSSFDGAVSLGRVQTPTLAILARREEEIRAFVPEPYWLVDATFEADGDARLRGPLPRRAPSRGSPTRRGGRGDRRRRPRPAAATITKLEKTKRTRARAAALRPHVAAARGQHPLRLLRAAHARRRAAPATRSTRRSPIRAPSSRYLTERHGPRDQADRRARRRATASTRRARSTSPGSTCCRSARVVNDEKVGDHHAIIPTNAPTQARQDERRRPPHLRHGRAPLPRRLPSRGRVREHARRDDGRRARLPHARQGAARARAGAASTASWPRPSATSGRGGRGPRPAAAEAREGRGGRHARGRVAREGDQAAAALLRRLAARRDGDRGQARRRRRAARGDEGLGHRHAGDARGDHRAPDRRRLRRARRPRAGRRPRRA